MKVKTERIKLDKETRAVAAFTIKLFLFWGIAITVVYYFMLQGVYQF